jgi:hypothetical protein
VSTSDHPAAHGARIARKGVSAAAEDSLVMPLYQHLKEHEDELLDEMMALRDRAMAPTEEARQFLLGFLRVVSSAARGDFEPRKEYLETVIPGVRASGFPFDATMDAMTRAAMGLVLGVDAKYRKWVTDFCADYVRRLVHGWEHAR